MHIIPKLTESESYKLKLKFQEREQPLAAAELELGQGVEGREGAARTSGVTIFLGVLE